MELGVRWILMTVSVCTVKMGATVLTVRILGSANALLASVDVTATSTFQFQLAQLMELGVLPLLRYLLKPPLLQSPAKMERAVSTVESVNARLLKDWASVNVLFNGTASFVKSLSVQKMLVPTVVSVEKFSSTLEIGACLRKRNPTATVLLDSSAIIVSKKWVNNWFCLWLGSFEVTKSLSDRPYFLAGELVLSWSLPQRWMHRPGWKRSAV